jgi:predicted nucleic acid-binding protein
MGVIVDTSVWVNVERGRLTHTEVAERIDNDSVYLAPPIVAELEYGVYRAVKPEHRNKRLAALARIKKKPCLIIDAVTGEIFGRLAADLDGRGTPSNHRVNGVWIAALAVQHGMRILTQNEKDFQDIPGLDVVTI